MGGGAMDFDLPMIQYKSSSSTLPALSFSSSSGLKFLASTNYNPAPLRLSCTAPCCNCLNGICSRLESDDQYGEEDPTRTNNVIVGSVPSESEVESAMVSLQNFVYGISSFESEFDELQQILDHCNVTTTYGRVLETFNLLQTDPSIKRLVVSLSSDKAVWDAVMNNKVLQVLQESYGKGDSSCSKSCDEKNPDMATSLLNWILEITRAKVVELIEGFQSLMNDVLQPLDYKERRRETRDDDVDDKVRSSLLLSIVILLIVVVARVNQVLKVDRAKL